MVPKPDGSKRMCIDFRNLNDCTEDASWPIPNITEMLRRIGTHKATVVAVLDLTQLHSPHAYTLHSYFSAEFINSLDCFLGQNELPLIFNRPWQLLY
jgi:hypothetical protein